MMFERDGIQGRLSIGLKFDKGYRGGVFTNFGEPVKLYKTGMAYDGEME